MCREVAKDKTRVFIPSYVAVESARWYTNTWMALPDMMEYYHERLEKWMMPAQVSRFRNTVLGMRVLHASLRVETRPIPADDKAREQLAREIALDLDIVNMRAKAILLAWAETLDGQSPETKIPSSFDEIASAVRLRTPAGSQFTTVRGLWMDDEQ